MDNKRKLEQIKDFLLQKSLITSEQLLAVEQEMEVSAKSAEEVFVSKNIFSPDDFAKIKGQAFNMESISLSDAKVEPEILNLLPQKVAKNYEMVIFDKQDEIIKVGLVNPQDFKAQEAIEFLAGQQGLTPQYFSISLSDYQSIVRQYSGFKKEIGTALESAREKFTEGEQAENINLEETGDSVDVIKSAPVAKIVSVIIRHAVEGGASDIHIEPKHRDGRVRYRVDGVLHTTITLPGYLYNAVVSRIKVLANLKLDETRKPQDGRIRMKLNGDEIDLRVSVFPMLNAEKVVMRVLDTSAGIPNLTELGFSEYHIKIIDNNITKPHGIFLLTGPTGSGKTTALYSVLNMLNGEGINITTLEDPIEYYIEGINQSQISPEIGFNFASGLRAILRQDPNVIMVGEIRDNETAELVVHAGLTGHLVFSTLHTNSAWGAIPRLIDMKGEPFLLASTLNILMAQRLVRKICPSCKQKMKLPSTAEKIVMKEIEDMPEQYLKEFRGQYDFYKGAGCVECGNTGYVSRTVVAEILEISSEFRDLIARDFVMDDVRALMKKQGFVTLMQDGIIKCLKGITTVEEIIRASQS
ncbi:MAG: GspE/PulE family protein [Candidatus Buchananbacteria bacterium]|nr:GspE/PulE family protein [Candidatus Buchananbacteria bacterium]